MATLVEKDKIREEYLQFPFAAVVGHPLAKRALLLLAVDPKLGGVIIAARPGTAKTILARSFHSLLPSIEAVSGCPSHCDPTHPQRWCSDCKQAYGSESGVQSLESRVVKPPFINLPLNVTEDRLLGGLALEATLQKGMRVAERGLLAEANRGVLYCDELNLLDDGPGNYLMDALSRGRMALERDGLSAEYPTEFILIGTFNPDEGEVRPGLTDRVGIMVSATATAGTEHRVEIMSRALNWDRDPVGLQSEFDEETEILRGLIAEGREILLQVKISDEQLLALMEASLRLGVMGNRADFFAARVALASAALEGRLEVDDIDLKTAIQLVLLPRATRMPEPEPDEPEPPEPPQPEEKPEDNDDQPDPPESQQQQEPQIEDLVMAALETELPTDILNLVQARQQRAKAGSRGETYNWKRGRHVQSVPGKPGRGRIAIIDTLRAAAPFQNIRKNGSEIKSKPVKSLTAKVQVRSDDLRLKRYKDKAGVLFIFVVDASGSMALNRMREAKGAVTQLLQEAYVHRDKVALLSFRGRQADILLPPSQSVELAKRSLDVLPTGGGTPLASALMSAWKMSESAKRQGINKTMVVLITDGRGNVLLEETEETAGLSKDERKTRAAQEIEQLATLLASEGLSTVVLDTQTNFLSKGEAANLARRLGGHYVYLPRADARAIAGTVSSAAEDIR
jgi:magnesium chelatase subunit D